MAHQIDIIVFANPDVDDCLTDAAERYVAEHPDLAGWDLAPRWTDETRESVTLTVPVWSLSQATHAYVTDSGTLKPEPREHPRITIDPEQCGGVPCIRHLRIPVTVVLEYLASGAEKEKILRDYPDLEAEDIPAALRFAADYVRAHAPDVCVGDLRAKIKN